MSAEALRARIAKLDSEIAVKTDLEVLKKLGQEKSLASRQLNAILDPVERLPVEISSEIFLQSIHQPFPRPGARHQAPMLLLHICSAWTTIALTVPALWASIEIIFHAAKDLNALRIWFQRARQSPLSVSLWGHFDDWNRSRDMAVTILGHGGQLKHLKIYHDGFGISKGPNLFEIGKKSPIVKSLPTFAMLETLNLSCGKFGSGFPVPQILQLLHLAPNIVEINISATVRCRTPIPEDLRVVLPRLRRLTLHPSDPGKHDQIFNYFSLPALEFLCVPNTAVAAGNLQGVLQRSAPPLQELVTDGKSVDVLVKGYFDLVPSLERLTIGDPQSKFLTDFCAAVTDSFAVLPQSPQSHHRALWKDGRSCTLFEASRSRGF
ncbi:F-box domain-containing protein [Mycena sanguinolenta]|uniref:F-box domain-containing protein n=1 Tax=Mycena sanguinolenta TaxID=230812 RepID=A0A8H6YNK0_9AGAR|nr:F-box domain-containing protein [Mycena sanguinolenta]